MTHSERVKERSITRMFIQVTKDEKGGKHFCDKTQKSLSPQTWRNKEKKCIKYRRGSRCKRSLTFSVLDHAISVQ